MSIININEVFHNSLIFIFHEFKKKQGQTVHKLQIATFCDIHIYINIYI